MTLLASFKHFHGVFQTPMLFRVITCCIYTASTANNNRSDLTNEEIVRSLFPSRYYILGYPTTRIACGTLSLVGENEQRRNQQRAGWNQLLVRNCTTDCTFACTCFEGSRFVWTWRGAAIVNDTCIYHACVLT